MWQVGAHSFKRCLMVFVAWGITAFMAATAQGQPVTINGSVALVEDTRETGAVRRATEDLRDDFAKVFGQKPRVVRNLEDAGAVAILVEHTHAALYPLRGRRDLG